MKKFIKQAGRFVLLFAYLVGTIGGFGWSLYNQSYLIAVCILAVGAMAFPEAIRMAGELMEGEDDDR